MRKTVCVFCGSHLGEDPAFKELAESLGNAIGSHGMDMVFGGGGTGLMGIVSQAALSAGAHVTGVIPEILYNVERPEANLSKLIITPTMAERKRWPTILWSYPAVSEPWKKHSKFLQAIG